MSDKSFGDHINRNIVKNPLLSSAVTGLSLEDLTHKAVLLPATTQEQIARLDKQQESQGRTLANADNENQRFPSGDAFTNVLLSHPPTNIPTNTPANIPTNLNYQNNEKNRISTQSKSSSKSEDEFDVNEYIARLQGTRYVSAPLHSHIKEDQNVNLEAEESLEEINLNERTEPEVQQSLTADIAQNFSQLPTVLPHVASAVFSSFSNMLSMRSREQTPDVPYQQDNQFERSNLKVPLMVEDSAPKDFGLPPKELPVTGISSYRITSKKKYAPIPGLSYGGAPSISSGSAPSMPYQNIPPIFNPEYTSKDMDVAKGFATAPGISEQKAPEKTFIEAEYKAKSMVIGYPQGNVPNISRSAEVGTVEVPRDTPYNVTGVPYNVAAGVTEAPTVPLAPKAPAYNQAVDEFKDITTPRLPIIPPPPMFSNQRKEAQVIAGKSVLPPSVARRISANQPLIKQSVPTPSFTENFFVPTVPVSSIEQSEPSVQLPGSVNIQSNPVQFFTPPPANIFNPSDNPLTPNIGFQTASSNIAPPSFPLPGVNMASNAFTTPPSTIFAPVGATSFTQQSGSQVHQPEMFISVGSTPKVGTAKPSSVSNVPMIPASNSKSTTGLSNEPVSMLIPPAYLDTTTHIPTIPATSELVPLIEPNDTGLSMANLIPSSVAPANPPPMPQSSSYFNPQTQETMKPAETKPLVEPPKAAGINFRMTKKRPQYYAGPIEGVGDISNNLKPVIAPIVPPVPSAGVNYQGPLFTPEQKQEPYTAENTSQNSEVPFDISKYTVAQNIETVPFNVSKQNYTQNVDANQNVGATGFDINVKPDDYSHQHAPYGSQQNYGQYNTAFDFSRPTTDAFDPPKQESKSFGIIGSLKSKLSSIDINKIQSTVTTFFDPAYNEGKSEPVTETTSSYAPQQYGAYSQTNFEVTVPSVDSQYQYHTNQGTNQEHQEYNYDQNQFYQSQNAHNFAQNEGNNAYNPQSYTQILYGTTDHYSSNYNQENIPQNVDLRHKYGEKKDNPVTFFNTATVQPTETKPKLSSEESAEIQKSNTTKVVNPFVNPNVGTHGAIGDVAKPINPIGQKSYKHVIETKALIFFDNPLGTNESVFTPHDIKDQIESKQFLALSKERFSPPLPPAMSFFDSPTVGHKEKKSEDLVEDMQKLALAEAIAIASIPIKEVNTTILCDESTVIDQKLETQNVQIFPTQIGNISNDIQKKSIIEVVTKDKAPLEVSSVPLYGLTAMITDKTQEISLDNQAVPKIQHESNLYPENRPTFTFFKDVAERNAEEPPKASLNISDVKNVLLIEPPQENIETILKRNTSSSLLKDLPESDAKIDENLSLDKDSTWNKDVFMETTKDNVNLLYDKNSSEFFDHFSPGTIQNLGISSEPALDLSICETCREVNTPEEKNSDLTKQLIENVMSSIQLSNAVEIPLPERKSFTIDEKARESELFDDINRIAEDTIETLQGQHASEHSDDSKSSPNYGWNTDQHAYAALVTDKTLINSNLMESDFALNTDKYTAIDPEYTYKTDPNTIGLFGDNSIFFDNVPNNASDEIKSELKTNEDVLPQQIIIPTAPPDEDTKSDETGGLDVLSIEQDAKKDFPLEEEFVIEPSETDDDKIEFRERKRSSEDSVNDTFADRIEKFKNKTGMEVTHDNIYQAAAQHKPMASYFDTGNYAAETHYLSNSAANIDAFQDTTNAKDSYEMTEEAFRLPPGFEDEIRRQYALGHTKNTEPIEEAYTLPPGFENEIRKQFNEFDTPDKNITVIPETSTQTRTTNTSTYSSLQSTIGTFKDFGTELTYSSLTANNFNKTGAQAGLKSIVQPLETKHSDITTDNREKDTYKSSFETPTLVKAFGVEITQKTDCIEVVKKDVTKAAQEKVNTTLADPMNFFSNEEAKPEQESINRLASYFSLPPAQPDHSKSFFELSQSQNHYRHVKNFQTDQNKALDDKTRANLHNLMHDLTSTDNITIGDNNVRTVNYFSVEYDTEPVFPKPENINVTKLNQTCSKTGQQSHTKPINIGENLENLMNKTQAEDDLIDGLKLNASNLGKTEDIKVNTDKINIINTCEYCCNIKLNEIEYKVKKAADSDTKEEKQILNMDETESFDKSHSITLDFDNITGQEAQDGVTVTNESRSTSEYTPVRHHWFYRVDVDDKSVWRGFSTTDSDALEQAYRGSELNEDTLVPTDGGRFDVNIIGRLRIAVYWKEKPTNVRRCSWFYKGTTDARYVPYTEAVADKLEEEFRHGVTTGEWHRRLVLPNNELVVMHGPAVMVHFLHAGATDSFSSPPFLLGKKVYRNPPKIRVARDLRPKVDHLILVVHGAGEYKKNSFEDSTTRPRVVRRGHEESEIEDPEPSSIDHLLLLCHGVGSACDMRFRSVEEVVEDFRSTSLQLLQSHYRNSYDNGVVNRVEVLPVSWHAQLHVGEKGVDARLNKVTLESIPRLRAFTNHTVLDALFYTSPVYHQTIIDTVCFELNRIYSLFKQRNPEFKGGVSLGGHSLGSVILYDLLCHQSPEKPITPLSTSNKSYLGAARPAQHQYPQLQFPPAALYALGSPIAIFECIRGVEALGMDFALPTCKNFFNIFHPYDPIAYRIEPLINPLLQDAKPFLIPHHKGRKRMHLELKDTMVRVGSDLKQKLLESLKTTWNKWKSSPPPDGQLEKVVEEEIEKEQLCDESKEDNSADPTTPEMLGKLNSGRRIDYVLQEAPLEMINEYLFAMSSHVGYWESEDTMLLMLREIYNSLGVPPDCTVPQQSMTVTRTKQDEATILNEKEHASTSREFL